MPELFTEKSKFKSNGTYELVKKNGDVTTSPVFRQRDNSVKKAGDMPKFYKNDVVKITAPVSPIAFRFGTVRELRNDGKLRVYFWGADLDVVIERHFVEVVELFQITMFASKPEWTSEL